jgi:hypothetical protein
MTIPTAFPDRPVRVTAHLDAPLSRWLWLVKWWLLAIPQYIVVGFFVGGYDADWWGGGLLAVLTLIAGVLLAFTEKYPKDLYDLIMGLNRWVLRVAAYSALMTDVYPPFRLDMGGSEESRTQTGPQDQR